MNVTFYNNPSLHNVINKTLNDARSFEVQMVEPVNDTETTLTVSAPLDYSTSPNYLKIGGRYYFITNIEHTVQGLSRVSARLDVLMTYRGAINSTQVLATRSTTFGSRHITDPLVGASAVGARKSIEFTRSISGEEADGMYVLTTSMNGY